MKQRVIDQLSAKIDPVLVDPLVHAYEDLQESSYLGKWKPSELDGAHVAEIMVRVLQSLTGQQVTPLGQRIPDLVATLRGFENLPRAHHDSLRLHIPRALLVICDVRNRRGVGHPAGEVSPNLQDCSIILACSSWVLAELIRHLFACSLAEAQVMVDSLVERRVPLIQDFDGFLKILDPRLSLPKKMMALLYQRGGQGASQDELAAWLQLTPRQRGAFATSLSRLDRQEALIHRSGNRAELTLAGIRWTEQNVPFR